MFIREITENFADGKKKGKSRPGRVKRSGASCNGSVTELRKKVYEAYEIEFVCVNPNFCDATDPKKQQALFNALKRVPGIIVYRQDFDVHNSMAAIIKDESDSVAPEKVQQLAKQHGVGIDLENDISQSMIDDIVTGRLEGLIDYYDTDLNENFADGKVKGKSRPGRVKRSGASCNGSVTELRSKAKKASGEKAKMYHWCANMKAGKKK